MDNIQQALSDVFDTRTTRITFFTYTEYPKEDIRINVLFKMHQHDYYVGKSFIKFRMKPKQPLFHSVQLENSTHLDKFNQLFNMHKNSREQFLSINEFIKHFDENSNFKKLLRFNSAIKNHEFYTFQRAPAGVSVLSMTEKNDGKHGITSCVHGKYRNVAQYEFVKNFAVTRDKKVVVFPTISFFNHVNPFSLYFSLIDNVVYKLPNDLTGLATVEDIVEASTVFTSHDVDIFTHEILMMYIKNLHSGIHSEFLLIPQDNLADKIDLLLMNTI